MSKYRLVLELAVRLFHNNYILIQTPMSCFKILIGVVSLFLYVTQVYNSHMFLYKFTQYFPITSFTIL